MYIGQKSFGTAFRDQDKANSLHKKELIEDFFNNRTPPMGDQQGSKLRISNTAKILEKDFKERVLHFLKKEKELTEQLDRIPILQLGQELRLDDQRVKKMRLYMQWSREGSNLKDLAFQKIKSFGKDEELKQIQQDNLKKKEELTTAVDQHSHNYYYKIYNQVYAFN